MNIKDKQIINIVFKHYKELSEALTQINNYEEFVANIIIKKAIILDLIQIGENINKLSDATISKLSQYNVRGVIAFRNQLVHGYGTIDNQIVWTTIHNQLPQFIDQLRDLDI